MKKKKKGKSGPNPLSCLKKKVKKTVGTEKQEKISVVVSESGTVGNVDGGRENGGKKKKTRSRRNRNHDGGNGVDGSSVGNRDE